MTAPRLAPRCLVPTCLLVALLPAPALAQQKGDAADMKLRIYGSLLPGLNKADARSFSQPLCDFLGGRVGQSIKCDVQDGTTPDDLFEFGKKLNSGECHLGAVWGIEYGWLRDKFPKLKVLVVVSYGDKDVPNHTQVFVSKNSGLEKLSDLKGKRLAVYKDTPLMDRIFLRRMLREDKLPEKDFFVAGEPLGSAKLAAVAVRNRKADCLIMNSTTYVRLRRLQPGLAESLVPLKTGAPYPMSVLIGSPEVVDRLRKRPGLWNDLRDQFLEAHTSPEGKECISFWRFQSFVAPDKEFLRQIDDLVQKLPVKELLTLE